jgi:tetratricopeptide (TPR) repeat protein
LFAIGLLSYESAIAIAPLAVLVDLFRGRTLRNRSSVLRYAAIGAVALIWLIARHQASAITEVPIQANLNFSPGITKAQIAASAPYFLATHLVMWLSPWNHHACLASYLWDRSIPAMILPFCWTASLLCMVLGIRFWKPGNLILFGLFWFLVASFPSGNFVPMANTPYANYYLCLPSVGLALALAQILGLLVSLFRKNTEHPRLRIFSFAAIALIVFWRVSATAVTHSWMHLWRNPVLVLLETAKDRPLQYHATAKASRLLLLMGQTDPARQLANQSIRDEPSTDLPYIILGQIAYEQKKYGEARKYFRKAIVARHYSAKVLRFAQLFLAKTMAESGGDVDEAWFYLLPLLKAHDYEYHADAVLTAATLFRNNNRPDDEIRTLEKGLSYHPDNQKLRKALNDAEKRIRDQPQQ